MTVNRPLSRLAQWGVINLYPLKMFLFFMLMLGVNVRYGPLLTMGVIWFSLIAAKESAKSTWFSGAVVAYIGYILFSVIGYSGNGRPLEVFWSSIENAVLPMLFFFVGLSPRIDKSLFYRRTIVALEFCFIIGMYLYFTLPSWYVEWKTASLTAWLDSSAEKYVLETAHFSSFFAHSYFTGYMSLVALIILFDWIREKPGKTYIYFLLLPALIALAFSMQRMSLGFFAVFLLVYIVQFSAVRLLKVSILLGVVIFVSALYLMDLKEFQDYLPKVIDRLSQMDLFMAIDERGGQWRALRETQTNFIFGHGFGAAGHAASALGFPAVVDGENYKIFFELGIVGIALHYFVMVATLVKGFLHFSRNRVEVPIVLFFTIATIGANPFSNMQTAMFFFWYAVGVIWAPRVAED